MTGSGKLRSLGAAAATGLLTAALFAALPPAMAGDGQVAPGPNPAFPMQPIKIRYFRTSREPLR